MKNILRRTGNIALWCATALAIITAVDYYRMPDQSGLKQQHFITIDGQHIDFTRTAKPVILYFWGEWCGICRHTSPHIQTLHRAGYPVASIAVQSGDDTAVRRYLHEHGWQFPVINDSHGETWEHFALAATPTVAFVSNGKILLSTSGWSSAWGIRLRYHLLALLPS